MPTTPAARSNATAGPSSPYPGTPTTPGTNLTAATTPGGGTTAGDTDADPYGDDEDDEDSGEDGDGVIRLEIGGETPEEKAKRIALATRKWVIAPSQDLVTSPSVLADRAGNL